MRYSKSYLSRMHPKADEHRDIECRKENLRLAALLAEEMKSKFGACTPENAAEYVEYQGQRLSEIGNARISQARQGALPRRKMHAPVYAPNTATTGRDS